MAVSASQVVVSTTAVALNPAETDAVSGGGITIRNSASVAADVLVIGDATVTPSTGFAIPALGQVTIQLSGGERIFAIRGAAADITAHVLRTGG